MAAELLTRLFQMIKRALREELSRLTAFWVALRWRVRGAGHSARPPNLDIPLVVSLTSYPPRYPMLLPTIQSLLMQSVKPDHLILWIADKDVGKLPAAILALQEHGLSIRTCSDLGSYKKIIPTLASHPDAIIVTADDDAYYWPTWLEELVSAYNPAAKEVLCHRAHQIVLNDNNWPASYRKWSFETADTIASQTTFPTGLGGTLYRPGIFMSDVSRQELFQTYCPTADDVWLFWMASLNGALFRKIGPVRRFILWRGGQKVALYNCNVLGADSNDEQIGAMIAAYGFPVVGKMK
jgi:hypothetical protein